MKIFRIVIILQILILGQCRHSQATMRTYYIDASTGDDMNNGLSPDQPWASLQQVNSQKFVAGDQILFKSGTSYNGQLIPHGRGTRKHPIVISSYGKGAKPIINGLGEKKYTLLLKNVEYYDVNNLEVTNQGENREPGRTGVFIHASNFGELHHIHLDHLEIHNINGSLVKSEGGGSAVYWKNEGDSIPTRFVDLRIENCYLHHCERNGIVSGGNIDRDHWYPSLQVVIRNNLLEMIPGDGIVPIGCDSAIVEYNVMRKCPDILSHKEAAAGIWPWSSDNTVIQYNEVSGHHAKWDGQGFDSDYNCHGTIIQYNYSHDNNGGFLLVCNDGNSLGKSWNHGTKNSIIQYNLSVNDGIRPYPTKREGWFSPTFHITGPVKNTTISHNVIVIPKKKVKEIEPVIYKMGNWGNAWPENTTIRDNVYFTNMDLVYDWGSAVNTINENNKIRSLNKTDEKSIFKMLRTLIDQATPQDKNGFEQLENFIEKRFTNHTKK